MQTVVAFGEIMVRFSAPEHLRLRQVLPGNLDAAFAGAEANIAATIALLGGKSRFVTAWPDNVLSEGARQYLRGVGIDTDYILQCEEGRMPVYYIENGAAQRSGTVLYDRTYSTFSMTPGDAYDWDAIFQSATWLVVTGISPALSAVAAEATLRAVQEAHRRGVIVCCDLNFRTQLWKWELGTSARDLAQRVMAELIPMVRYVITNPDQARDVLATPWDENAGGDLSASIAAIENVAKAYPHLQGVTFTLRHSHSASHNGIGGIYHDVAGCETIVAPMRDGKYAPYEVSPIIDRVGAGDAFAGAWIYAMQTPELSAPRKALEFGLAASCLAHSISGDFNFVSRAEIEALMAGNRSGRIIR